MAGWRNQSSSCLSIRPEALSIEEKLRIKPSRAKS